jgi:hypothetical protein
MKKIINSIGIFLIIFTSLFAYAKKPERVLVMMFDQMRPDYIERYDLKNFKRLQKIGTNYPNALVGHSASVTIVSHLVVGTGLLPKNLPWADSFMWDREAVLGKKDEVYLATSLPLDDLMKALKTIPSEQWVGKRYKNKFNKNVRLLSPELSIKKAVIKKQCDFLMLKPLSPKS